MGKSFYALGKHAEKYIFVQQQVLQYLVQHLVTVFVQILYYNLKTYRLRIMATIVFISAIAKFCPMQFLQSHIVKQRSLDNTLQHSHSHLSVERTIPQHSSTLKIGFIYFITLIGFL